MGLQRERKPPKRAKNGKARSAAVVERGTDQPKKRGADQHSAEPVQASRFNDIAAYLESIDGCASVPMTGEELMELMRGDE